MFPPDDVYDSLQLLSFCFALSWPPDDKIIKHRTSSLLLLPHAFHALEQIVYFSYQYRNGVTLSMSSRFRKKNTHNKIMIKIILFQSFRTDFMYIVKTLQVNICYLTWLFSRFSSQFRITYTDFFFFYFIFFYRSIEFETITWVHIQHTVQMEWKGKNWSDGKKANK